jgi:hypothetical protein
MFMVSIHVRLGDGASARFWMDSWHPEGPIAPFAPSLFQAIGRRRQNQSVKEALDQCSWVHDITGAPTAPVLYDYVLLWKKLVDVHLQPAGPDHLVWNWTADGKYSSSSAHRSFFYGRTPLVGARHLWHAHAPAKVKFFFWVGLHGRLWMQIDGGDMDFSKMPPAPSTPRKTKPQITSCAHACSRAKFGTGFFIWWGCTT